MSDVQKPSKEMLENLELLMNLELLKSEPDWSLLDTFNFNKAKPTSPSKGPAPEKENAHEQ